MTAPAVRILMLQLCLGHEYAALLEQLDDRFVRLKNRFAFVFRKPIAHSAGFVYVAGLVEFVARPGIEVVGAMRRSGMHRSRSLIGGYVIRQHPENLPIQERMGKGDFFEFPSGKSRNDLCAG